MKYPCKDCEKRNVCTKRIARKEMNIRKREKRILNITKSGQGIA